MNQYIIYNRREPARGNDEPQSRNGLNGLHKIVEHNLRRADINPIRIYLKDTKHLSIYKISQWRVVTAFHDIELYLLVVSERENNSPKHVFMNKTYHSG